MPLTCTVHLDHDDSGAFSHDLTPDVLALAWRLGFAAPYATASAPVEAVVTLRNRAAAYSPEAPGGGALVPARRVRIQSDDGVTLRTLFVGALAAVVPQVGALGERLARLTLRGIDAELDALVVNPPLLRDVRADTALTTLLDTLPLRPHVLKARWLLGVAGQGELDAATTLPTPVAAAFIETGIARFAWIGALDTPDTRSSVSGVPLTPPTRSAWAYARRLADAERGRLFVNRAGDLVFYNRHHTLLTSTPAAAFNDTMDDLRYTYGADVVNNVAVTFVERAVGAPDSLVWTLHAPQRLEPGTGYRLTAGYRDADGLPIAAFDVRSPVPGFDYAVNTAADGTGADALATTEIALVTAGASAAELYAYNRGDVPVYLLAGAQLRGTPVVTGGAVTLTTLDYASRSRYGAAALAYDLPLIDTFDAARDIAAFELARRTRPAGMCASVTLDVRRHPDALALTLFDCVTLTEAQTAHSADYFIIAEEHAVDLGGARHTVTWRLEPVASAFWTVGTGTLDQSATLAY